MIRHLLNENVDVYRATFTPDGRGGRTKSMAKVATIRARIMPLPKLLETRVAAELSELELRVAHVLFSADVRREDELDTGAPERLRVIAVMHDSSSTYKRLDCQVIEGTAGGA